MKVSLASKLTKTKHVCKIIWWNSVILFWILWAKGIILFGRFIKKTVTHSASSQHTKSMKVWLLMKHILSMNWKAKHCHIIHSKRSQWFFKDKKLQFSCSIFALYILLELYYFAWNKRSSWNIWQKY